jgi:hypothetical protein
MNEYTTDIRDLDCLLLAKIGGAQYYEVHTIVRERDGVRETIGRASDWPLIKERATNAELAALLTATIQHVSESEAHVAELIARQTVYEQHIAALEQALAEMQPPPTLPPTEIQEAEQAFVQAAAPVPRDGKVPCDHPGCDARVWPRGLNAHKTRKHGADRQPIAVVAPTPAIALPPIALALGERPWRCANPRCSGAHARSVAQPDLCIRCVVELTDTHLSNGHQVAA